MSYKVRSALTLFLKMQHIFPLRLIYGNNLSLMQMLYFFMCDFIYEKYLVNAKNGIQLSWVTRKTQNAWNYTHASNVHHLSSSPCVLSHIMYICCYNFLSDFRYSLFYHFTVTQNWNLHSHFHKQTLNFFEVKCHIYWNIYKLVNYLTCAVMLLFFIRFLFVLFLMWHWQSFWVLYS